MKRDEFLSVLNHLKPALASKDYIPIIDCYCFAGGKVFAYDSLIGIRTKCDLPIEGAIKGNVLRGLVEYSEDGDVSVETKGNKIKISCGKSTSNLPVMPKEDFIFDFPRYQEDFSVDFSPEHLKAIRLCLNTVSLDSTHPERMGVTVSIGKFETDFYSTNGKAITHVRVGKGHDRFDDPITIILPLSFCKVVADLSSEYPDQRLDFCISDEKNRFIVSRFGDDYEMFSQLVSGIDPVSFDKVIRSNLEGVEERHYSSVPPELTRILSRMSVIVDSSKSGRCSVEVKDGVLIVRGVSDFGNTEEQVELNGDPEDVTAYCYADLFAKSIDLAEEFVVKQKSLIIRSKDSMSIVANLKPEAVGAESGE